MFGFLGVLGGILGAIVGAAIVVAGIATSVVVAPAVAVGVAAGIGACLLNAFNICPPSPSPTGSGANTTVSSAANSGTKGSSNNSAGNTNANSPVGQICTSPANAACGITSQGTIVGGVCNAVTPPNSACPAPVISVSTGFYAQPSLVKSGQQTTLYWSATNATGCTVSGGTLGTLAGLLASGNHLTGAVNQKTIYTLTCTNGAGGPQKTVNTTVNLIPEYQNQ